MCTTPRQLLPSVFGGNVYPCGLRRTLKLLTCPTATDNGAALVMEFALVIGWGGKANIFRRGFTECLCGNVCTGVNVCACIDCCRPELVRTPTHTNFFVMTWKLCSAMLYGRKLLGPSVILPMKVNRLCAWTNSKFPMLPLPLHIAGVQYHYHQLYPAYSSVSAVCQISTINSAFRWPNYNPLMNTEI